jgi:hypothetical protein
MSIFTVKKRVFCPKISRDICYSGIDNAPRLSLAGAQSKFAVFRSFDGTNTYYRSDDNHPTTHIIKVANKRFSII